MGIIPTFRRQAPDGFGVDVLSDRLRAEQDTNLVLTESLVDAERALDDQGWQRISDVSDVELSRDGLARAADVGRAMAVTNTLIGRGLALRAAYVWGSGVTVGVRADPDVSPDVNTVVQAFLDDEGNRAAWSGEQAHEETERALGTDGNVFFALITSPRTGRVRIRDIPFAEVMDVIRNPDDAAEPWFYTRRWWVQELTSAGDRAPGTAMRESVYPALGHDPPVNQRPTTLNGVRVEWDKPVLHVTVNRIKGNKYGIGDVYTAIPWARAYREFLADWAQLVKALSQFAWRTTSKGSRASKAAAAIKARATTGQTGSTAGATLAMADAHTIEAVPKTGATIDSESGRPLAAMVAAGLDIPVTMLLGDPGVTGSRATAQTLDHPMLLGMQARRARHTETYRRVVGHVITAAVSAPQGLLRHHGTTVIDADTGARTTTLTGTAPTVEVTWPDLTQTDPATAVKAVTDADATGKLPPLTVVRLLLDALGVDDADEIITQVTDPDTGEWADPLAGAALADATAAARAALDAVRVGDQPPA
jgi:hypothetical protein